MSEYEFWDELGNIFKAVVTYQQKTIEFNKRFVNPWIRLSTVFDRQDQIADSMRAYKKAIEIDPENAANWSTLGDVYFKSGSFEDAITAYNRAIELNPRAGWAHANLALACATRQNYTEAVNLYIKSLELINDDKDRAMIWNRLGNVYRKVNDYENAMIAFQMADECDDGNTGFADKLDEITVEQRILPIEAGESIEPDAVVTSVQEEAELHTKIAPSEIPVTIDEAELLRRQTSVTENPESAALELGDHRHPSSIEDVAASEWVKESESHGLILGIKPNVERPYNVTPGEPPFEEDNSDLMAEFQEGIEVISRDLISMESESSSSVPIDRVTELPASANRDDDVKDEELTAVSALDQPSIFEPSTENIVTSDPTEAVETITDARGMDQPVIVVVNESIPDPVVVEVLIENEDGGGEQNVVSQLTLVEESVSGDPASVTEDQSGDRDEGNEIVDPVVEVEEQTIVISPEISPVLEVQLVDDPALTESDTSSEPGVSFELEYESSDIAEGKPDAEFEPATANDSDEQSNESIIQEILSLAGGEAIREAAYEEFLNDVMIPLLETSKEQESVDLTQIPSENREINIEPDTNNAHVWNELGNVYFNTGAYEGAIAAYSKAIDLDGWFAWPYSNLALAYVHKEKYGEAVSLYQKSIELFASDKDKAITWNRLGNVYRRMNDYENAIASYQRADELDPNNATRSLRSRFSLLGSLSMDQSPSLVF